ncbi:MAG TPA: hypothetical protein VHB77_14190 [Planctomycetaceae bacterium]|nr:hypothetical protein [Planctomycetaceae bacterium]
MIIILAASVIGLTLCSVVAGLRMRSYSRHRVDAIAYVESTGGQVEFEETFRLNWVPVAPAAWNQTVRSISIDGHPKFDLRRILPLSEATTLTGLDTHFDPEGFGAIRQFTKMHALELFDCELTDTEMAELSGCRCLERLAVDAKSVTDAGLRSLVGLPIRSLSLGNTGITDAGLAHLSSLRLEKLDIRGTAVTDAGLEHLAHLPLTELDLAKTRITDAGLRHLSSLPLRELLLFDTRIGDAGIGELRPIQTLEELFVIDTDITADGLLALQGMMLSVYASSPPLTPADVERLRPKGVFLNLSPRSK